MSAFRSILVPVADAESSGPSLEAAFRLAQAHAAHVCALHTRIDPALAVPLIGEGLSGAMVEEMITQAEQQGLQRAERARRAFDETCARFGLPVVTAPPAAGPSAAWVEVVGREEDEVVTRGRLADLTLLGHPRGEREMPATMTLNSVLLASGRPVLLSPPQGGAFGSVAAIAWNGSVESSRAVGWALPLLSRAQRVIVLSVSEQGHTLPDSPAGDLVTYLGWHGIGAEIVSGHAAGSQAGPELLRLAQANGADLLVTGAFTHSRLRQLILGGVTRHVIAHAPIHCLMCH
jgi:nucleotide-binding universal stress UspA family protein